VSDLFLTTDEVSWLHEQQLERFGGAQGVRDEGLLDSAVALPGASFEGEFLHRDLFEMAAAYGFHLAQNQPFLDGNKRTALTAALVFLDLNGVWIADPEGEMYDAMMALAERRLDKGGLADVLRKLAARTP